jgi:PPOX class probable F420-dependent enzyme
MATIDPDLRALLEGANFAHLATLMPDGSPHSVAIWAGLEGERVVFFSQAGSQKARNLARDPRLALSITDHANPYRTGRLRGRVAQRRDGEAAFAAMDALSVKYTGQPFPMRGADTVAFLVDVEHAASMALPFEHRPAG